MQIRQGISHLKAALVENDNYTPRVYAKVSSLLLKSIKLSLLVQAHPDWTGDWRVRTSINPSPHVKRSTGNLGRNIIDSRDPTDRALLVLCSRIEGFRICCFASHIQIQSFPGSARTYRLST